MKLDLKLREDYENLWKNCIVKSSIKSTINQKLVEFDRDSQRYMDLELATGVPWWFIALLHMMECNNDFTKHLHNGDPLTSRTIQVPIGRPIEPPENGKCYTFEESAIDALEYEKLDQWEDWSIIGVLFQVESYNGFGYRRWHPQVKTPYLWSFTNQYSKGKYIGDGVWSSTAVSKQIGIACYLQAMQDNGFFDKSS